MLKAARTVAERRGLNPAPVTRSRAVGEPSQSPAHFQSSANELEKLNSDDGKTNEVRDTDCVQLDREYDHSDRLLRRGGDGENVGEKRNVRSKQSPGLSRTGSRVGETGSTTTVEFSTRGLSSSQDKHSSEKINTKGQP